MEYKSASFSVRPAKQLMTALAAIILSVAVQAQPGKVFAVADYQRATDMLGGNAGKLVDNAIQPQWLPDGRLWYRSLTENQSKYILFNPADGKKWRPIQKRNLMR